MQCYVGSNISGKGGDFMKCTCNVASNTGDIMCAVHGYVQSLGRVGGMNEQNNSL